MDSDSRTELFSQSLLQALHEIQNAQLIRRAKEDQAEYGFKHALVQETAYASLLRHDRKRLHRLVAEALEQATPERLDELAPRLAEHFDEAGETERALSYLQRAAENAAARYANHEALDFYTRALDAAEELETDTRDSLYRARGVVYERIGEFDKARADLENALQIAQQTGNSFAEWQSLMDLGFAWTARDFARAGEFFEKALVLARASNDKARLAHTLNRVGNWYANNDEPQRAAAYHAEALAMFEASNDVRGIAETHDLLNMMSALGGNYVAAEKHAQAALEAFEALHDPFAVTNTRIASYLIYSLGQGDTLPVLDAWADRKLEDKLALVKRETQQLGWRAGEAFALLVLGEAFSVDGQYGRALELLARGIELAREIQHRQWYAATTLMYGETLAHVLNFESAQVYLESALRLARELGSRYWTLNGSGFLAAVLIKQSELIRAAEVLDAAMPQNAPAQSIGKRQVWASRVELALARQETDHALEILALLLRDTIELKETTVIPRVWLLRAQAMFQKKELRQAESLLLAARTKSRTTNQPSWEWRARAHLARVYRAQGRDAEAEREANAAQNIVTALADTLNDVTLRETFVTRARQMIWGA